MDGPQGSELARQLRTFNATSRAFSRVGPVHVLFSEQARRTPEACALEWRGQRTSYRALDAWVVRIAGHLGRLRREGDPPFVGVCMQRTPMLIASVLGVLKAGAAYVPIEPGQAGERVAFMLADSSATLLLTDRASAARLPPFAGQLVIVDELDAEGPPAAGPQPCADPDALAYVLYTSGTTGTPKGVCVPHRALTNQVLWASESLLSPAHLSRTLFSTSLCFDACLDELFLPLVCGGTIVLVENLLSLLEQRDLDVSFVNATPSALQALLLGRALPASLRAVVLGGEVVSPALVAELRQRPGMERIANVYGPTECTNECVALLYEQSGEIPDTIGRPIANTRAYVLDGELSPLPIGEPGELYIGGAGVAAGYLNQPDLTAVHFLRDPFDGDPSARLYRTGDMARWRPDGTLQYLGRRDRQVKVRGHRIELSEVERVIVGHPTVQQCVVVLRAGQLAAYLTPKGIDVSALREHARARLPAAAVPTFLVPLDAFPCTPHGKLDETALPAPLSVASPWPFVDATERHIAAIYAEVLGVAVPSPQLDFVSLGGDSLSAVRIQALVEERYGRQPPLALFFQDLTVPKLARFVQEAAPEADLWMVFREGDPESHPTLVCPHSAGGLAQSTRWLAQLLDPEIPVHTFNHPHDRRLRDWRNLEDMAAFYVASLVNRFPTGPYLFAGHSFGALLGFEMARQLRRDGRPVIFLGIVDEPAEPLPPLPDALLLRISAEHLMYYDAVAQGCEPLQRWFRADQARQADPTKLRIGPVMGSDLWLLISSVLHYLLGGGQAFRSGLSRRYVERMREHGGDPRLGEPDFLLPLLDDLVHTVRLGDAYLRRLSLDSADRLDVPTWLFRAREKPPRTGTLRDAMYYGPPDRGWNRHLAEPVTEVDCEGDHVTIQTHPTVRSLAAEMNRALRSAMARWRRRAEDPKVPGDPRSLPPPSHRTAHTSSGS